MYATKYLIINFNNITMKKLITICYLLSMAFTSNAQNNTSIKTSLNKQQTVEYIEKVFKSTYKFEDFKVTSVILDSKTLVLNYSDGEVVRKDLSLPYSIKILKYELGYAVGFDTIERKIILGPIQIESDALRLKKALEHLIEILKTEKNTDPFGE